MPDDVRALVVHVVGRPSSLREGIGCIRGAEEHGDGGQADGVIDGVVVRQVKIQGGVERLLLGESEQGGERGVRRRGNLAGREDGMGAFVIHDGQADLLEVVDALGAAGGLAGRLHGGEQQGDENSDDRDDDQELDQSESTAMMHGKNLRREERRE